MSTPILEGAMSCGQFGEVKIVVRQSIAPLLDDGPLAPHVHAVADDSAELEFLRAFRPDLVLLLSNSFRAAWRAKQAGIGLRLGAALSKRGWLLTHAVRPPTFQGRRFPIPTAHLQRDVAGLAGIHPPSLEPRLHVRGELIEKQRAELAALGLGASERYVVCTPGAAFGAAKLYPPHLLARALDLIADRHALRPVVSGGPGEEPLIEAVASQCRSNAISLASRPRSLGSLKALIQGADLLIVGDSGPRWVAAAFGVACVSILGPNIPQLTATSLDRCEIVRIEDLSCSPCAQRACPLKHHHCMQLLPPERVAEAAARVLLSEAQKRAARFSSKGSVSNFVAPQTGAINQESAA